MPLNSLSFILSFGVFFVLYWRFFSKNGILQNGLILIGSYLFYCWWDWRFLPLLILNSGLCYYLGIRMTATENSGKKNFLLAIGLLEGLGALFYFKYYGFFAHRNILLPLGISFYTFKTISYLLDVKRNKIEPISDWLAFFTYVAFFPSITAGPIDRAGILVPQLKAPRSFDYQQTIDGMRQALWGLFKKIVIADNCAILASDAFNGYQNLPGNTLLAGAIFFTIQLYADFSGYSDIAIGISSMLGFRITRNFNYPFFAENIVEYWRRWHISLTTWLTDYVFTPLSITFRDYGNAGLIAAIIITFTAIGIWHGPNYTYALYGFLNGCFYIPAILRGTMFKKKKTKTQAPAFQPKLFFRRIGNFILVTFSLILFRADSVTSALGYYGRIFSPSLFAKPVLTEKPYTLAPLLFIPVMFYVEWRQRDKPHALQLEEKQPLKILIYAGLLAIILGFSATKNTDFIYFKF